MIIDSHCHLEYEPLSKDLDSVVDRALKNGVKYLLTISTTNKSFDKIIKIITKYPSIYGSYGIHPHESELNLDINCSEILKKIKLNKKIILSNSPKEAAEYINNAIVGNDLWKIFLYLVTILIFFEIFLTSIYIKND